MEKLSKLLVSCSASKDRGLRGCVQSTGLVEQRLLVLVSSGDRDTQRPAACEQPRVAP